MGPGRDQVAKATGAYELLVAQDDNAKEKPGGFRFLAPLLVSLLSVRFKAASVCKAHLVGCCCFDASRAEQRELRSRLLRSLLGGKRKFPVCEKHLGCSCCEFLLSGSFAGSIQTS